MQSLPSLLADALFTRTQQRVLSLLLGQPERSFYLNELVQRAGMGSGTVQRELARLTAAGLLTSTSVGNQRHYQANRECPVYDELRAIVTKTFGVADVIREALGKVSGVIDVAFIYGSLAKGTETARSDIDLLIVSDSLAYPDVVAELGALEGTLGRTIHPTLYRPSELSKKLEAGNAFVRKILEQPKIFLLGSERDLPEPSTRE